MPVYANKGVLDLFKVYTCRGGAQPNESALHSLPASGGHELHRYNTVTKILFQ